MDRRMEMSEGLGEGEGVGIYLDNGATTPLDDTVLQTMRPLLTNHGNASSRHARGMKVRRAIDVARRQVASALGCSPGGVVFTSGGTESNNLAVFGFARSGRQARLGSHVVVGGVEHSCVSAAAKELQNEGFEVDFCRYNSNGEVDIEHFTGLLRPDTVLVSHMLVQNLLGNVFPLKAMADIVRRRCPQAVFHADAVQALGKIDMLLPILGVDAVTISSHKVHGPAGAGALVMSTTISRKPKPLLFGGGHEDGLRPGSENWAAIVGFGEAVSLATAQRKKVVAHLLALREQFSAGVRAIPNVDFTIPEPEAGAFSTRDRAPHILSLIVQGPPSEVFLGHLEQIGIYASAGSACQARSRTLSPQLMALGLRPEQVRHVVRISMSRLNTDLEIETVLKAIAEIMPKLNSKTAEEARREEGDARNRERAMKAKQHRKPHGWMAKKKNASAGVVESKDAKEPAPGKETNASDSSAVSHAKRESKHSPRGDVKKPRPEPTGTGEGSPTAGPAGDAGSPKTSSGAKIDAEISTSPTVMAGVKCTTDGCVITNPVAFKSLAEEVSKPPVGGGGGGGGGGSGGSTDVTSGSKAKPVSIVKASDKADSSLTSVLSSTAMFSGSVMQSAPRSGGVVDLPELFTPVSTPPQALLVREGEIILKKKNYAHFAAILNNAVTSALTGILETVRPRNRKGRGRYWLMPKDPEDAVHLPRAMERLRIVFGLSSISPIWSCKFGDFDALVKLVASVLGDAIANHGGGTGGYKPTFRLLARHMDGMREVKSSRDLEINIFKELHKRGVGEVATLQLKKSDIVVGVEAQGGEYLVFSRRVQCAKGLPVPSSGHGLCLLSGGIDSPVAAFMAMRRGVQVNYISFHSYPYLGESSKRKIADLVRQLARYQPTSRLIVVPFTESQTAIKDNCREAYRTVLYRRMMQRIACRVADMAGTKAKALITGECVGQVASQTLENMHCIGSASDRPVLRPLVCMDKEEIMTIARSIGTYDISIKPEPDCCTVFQPSNPTVQGSLEKALEQERKLDIEGIVGRAIEGMVVADVHADPF